MTPRPWHLILFADTFSHNRGLLLEKLPHILVSNLPAPKNEKLVNMALSAAENLVNMAPFGALFGALFEALCEALFGALFEALFGALLLLSRPLLWPLCSF